ncbi:unnamed protein product [Phytophthora fragariaefolia]|uniref:Unnamed protein product n=1 Tax=Phytophthora fragariaefolia TaxID=1490495 RepID=A0A9W6XM96_9STRA|nr:unnamed protein product [Phytophthora fragariaefolia]
MVPFVLSELPSGVSQAEAIEKAKAGKGMEARAGSDGALVFDLALVEPVARAFTETREKADQASRPALAFDEALFGGKLLTLPHGEVTLKSVEMNVRVALLYVLHWLYGHGTVVVNGCVEDSATAEISRAQLWQWVYHRVPLAGTSQQVDARDVAKSATRRKHNTTSSASLPRGCTTPRFLDDNNALSPSVHHDVPTRTRVAHEDSSVFLDDREVRATTKTRKLRHAIKSVAGLVLTT